MDPSLAAELPRTGASEVLSLLGFGLVAQALVFWATRGKGH